MGKAIKHFLVVLGTQLPVVGVAVTCWTEILQHPVIAAGVTVMYEVVLITWAVLGKEVWKQLKPEVVRATADWVKVTVLNLCSNFRRRYKQHVIYEHRVFNVRGLHTKGSYIEVEHVFVELHIAPSHLQQVSTNPFLFKELSGSQPIWTVLRRFTKKKATALAILGPAGCGKTTLLQHLTLTFAANRQRRYRLRAYTPILLFLREHDKAIVEESLPLADLAQRHFADHARYPELDPPPQWFHRHLRKGACLVLLDGLDEVVDAPQRQKIATWVDRQIRNYPRCHFLLTARPQQVLVHPERSDAEWVSVLTAEAAALCPPLRARIDAGCVYRLPESVPRFDVGCYRRIDAMRADQRSARGRRLHLCGDYLVGPHLEAAAASAERVASEVLEGLRGGRLGESPDVRAGELRPPITR